MANGLSDSLRSTLQAQDAEISIASRKFDERLKHALELALLALIPWLMQNLTLVNGDIALSAANLKVLATVGERLFQLMMESGLSTATSDFSAVLEDQGKFLSRILQELHLPNFDEGLSNASINARLAQLSRQVMLWSEYAALAAESTIGSSPQDIVYAVKRQFAKLSPGQYAATLLSTHSRTLANAVYQAEESKHGPLNYIYAGPPSGDPVIRPFCKKLMSEVEGGQSWTRDEIDEMDNGQIPNVFISCGGFNCRHQWLPFK